MLGIVYLRLTSAAPSVPYRRRVSALDAISYIARNSDSGFASQINPAAGSAGGCSSERFDPTLVAMQGRSDAMASRSALDMPSEREAAQNVQIGEEAARVRRKSHELNTRVRMCAMPKRLGPRSVDRPGDQELDTMLRIESHERIDEQVGALYRLDGAECPESDRLIWASDSGTATCWIQRHAVWDDFEQAGRR